MKKVNLTEKFALINEHWRPKVVGELNGQEIKLVKFVGEFPWHRHENEDEMFLAMKGNFRIEFRDKTVELSEGDFVIVPRGVEHRPVARHGEVRMINIEPGGTHNLGEDSPQRPVVAV